MNRGEVLKENPKFDDIAPGLRAEREIKINGYRIQEWQLRDGRFQTTINGRRCLPGITYEIAVQAAADSMPTGEA